jgi:zinc transport system permease protein
VIALLTLPVATAAQFTGSMRAMMVGAALLSVTLTTLGLAVSYGPDLPAGATTIVLAGLVYLAVMGARALRRRRASRHRWN